MRTGHNLISIPGTIRAEYVADHEWGHLYALFGSDIESLDAPDEIPAGSWCKSMFIGAQVPGYPSAHSRSA